ncbi:hypothetical protein LAZ67_1001896 [Cordylochernes scorpioides]|uniref:RNA-directed DNA polymerase n=1 Tax=Cordylochernes scorpioides TaxID=51811 RepID=A0ABY6JVR6_9ARAC|nr:hypothetical protein LAZ67_1001896 [Cordylochernes scorpioides]
MRRARDNIFWPGMNAQIRQEIENCSICLSNTQNQVREPMKSHKIPNYPWERISLDIFEIFKQNYLIIVDQYSDFFEVECLENTTSEYIIECCKRQFSRYGIPQIMVSDNGRQFTSTEFQKFSKEWQFQHSTSSPLHSQGNGKAEAAVKIAKNILKKSKQENITFHFQTPSRVLIIPNCMLQLPLKRLRFNQISPFAPNNKKFRNDIVTERLSRQDKEMELNQDQDIMELNLNEPVQNAPTQRDNSHTKNIGDHTPLHNSHMTNPHNELDTHTNTQQNPLPHAYYNTTPNTHYTPRNFSLNPIANTLCPQHIKPQDGFHTHNTRTHTSSHNGNTHNQPNKRDTHTKRRHQPVNTCTTVKNNAIIPSTQNIEKIHATKQPHNRKTLRSFLKAVNAYKEFIPDHARLRTPLVNLLKKDVVWVWSDECQKAFTNLKESLTTNPTLHLYQEGLPCQVYCNTSTFSITGVLKQVYPDGKTYTVQHFSRSLRSHERNYSDLELQCLAIVESVDNFRTCLMGRKFTIFSDHPALQWLKEIKAPSGRLFRWRLRLSRYEYEVRSINGVQQYETGVGTRIPFCGFLDAPLIQSQQSSPPGKSRVTMDHNKLRTVSRKGVLKTIVPSSFTTRLLKSVHTQHHHPNISKMTRLISSQYYWQNMTQDIAKQVTTCPTCRFARRIDEYNQPSRKNTDTGTKAKQNSYIKHSVHTTQTMPKLPHPRQRNDHTSQPKPITADISLIKPLTIKQENCKPDNQFNHITPPPKDIKQENCEPTNHSNSTINKHLSNCYEVKKWINERIAAKEPVYFRDRIRQLPERWEKVVASDGQYFEH